VQPWSLEKGSRQDLTNFLIIRSLSSQYSYIFLVVQKVAANTGRHKNTMRMNLLASFAVIVRL
jgi:hypothetical protein